jgi:hypothetical protein
MSKRLLLLLLVTAGCVLGDHRFTWEGRYESASEALGQAKDDKDRFYALNDAAKAAFEIGMVDDAARHAQELLDLATRFTGDWNYGNAIHDGHMVLGRVALSRGNVEGAKKELLMAGGTKGSPQLNSFGPNMSLAKDLLEQKQVDVVVEYLQLCGKFWEMEDGRLKRWSGLAKAGRLPDDFGGNLLY